MSSLRYFDLTIPAPKRLALMRQAFARHSTDYPHCPDYAKPANWRKVRAYTLGGYAAAFGLASVNMAGELYSFDENSIPVRRVRFADAVTRISHKGWYVDCEGNGDRGVIRGIVASLSHGRFIAGWHWSDNGEYSLDTNEVFSNDDDAAKAADNAAERIADDYREDDYRFRQMSDAESLCESKESELRSALEDRHDGRKAREWIRELISDLRAFRRELTEKTAAYERG